MPVENYIYALAGLESDVFSLEVNGTIHFGMDTCIRGTFSTTKNTKIVIET